MLMLSVYAFSSCIWRPSSFPQYGFYVDSPNLGAHYSLAHNTAWKVEVRERTTSPVSMEAASRMMAEPPDFSYSCRSAMV